MESWGLHGATPLLHRQGCPFQAGWATQPCLQPGLKGLLGSGMRPQCIGSTQHFASGAQSCKWSVVQALAEVLFQQQVELPAQKLILPIRWLPLNPVAESSFAMWGRIFLAKQGPVMWSRLFLTVSFNSYLICIRTLKTVVCYRLFHFYIVHL